MVGRSRKPMQDDAPASTQAELSNALGSIDLYRGFEFGYWLIDPVVLGTDAVPDILAHLQPVVVPIANQAFTDLNRPKLLCAHGPQEQLKLAQEAFMWAARECLQSAPPQIPRARTLCGFVACDLRPLALARILANAALVVDVSGVTRVLRYWDPRVLEHCERDPSAPDILPLDLNCAWSFLDCHASLRQIVHRAGDVRRQGLTSPLATSQQRWLDKVSDRNAVLKAMKNASADWALIDAALDAACQAGLTARADLITFASARLQAACAIERSSRMQELLGAVRAHGMALNGLMAELEDSDLDLIRLQAAEQAGGAGYGTGMTKEARS